MRGLGHGSLVRDIGYRVAPGYMADRARRYERGVRSKEGVTAIAQRLLDGSAPVVQHGPFAGLRYPAERVADVDAPVAKLLGIYEQEIADVFEDAIRRGTRTFVDVGCADGYYATGMALASSGLTTHAFDIARSARELCATVASMNGVAERVSINSRFSAAWLDGIDMNGALLLCDIEGAERTLFDEALISRLRHAFVTIEVHEHAVPGLCERLQSAFAVSHTHRTVHQRKRRPQDFAEVPLSAGELAVAIDERRPPEVHWLVLNPRG